MNEGGMNEGRQGEFEADFYGMTPIYYCLQLRNFIFLQSRLSTTAGNVHDLNKQIPVLTLIDMAINFPVNSTEPIGYIMSIGIPCQGNGTLEFTI
jgi:hypothetical protein